MGGRDAMATQLKPELPHGAFRRAKQSVSFRKGGEKSNGKCWLILTQRNPRASEADGGLSIVAPDASAAALEIPGDSFFL